VPDDKPRIWRVGPAGTAFWFTDPRLTGFFGFAGGPAGGRIDPSGKWLYISITVAAEPALTAQIWRVRLADHPTAADLQLVHEFPFDPTAPAPPQATGLAFAKSGNLYVSLIGPIDRRRRETDWLLQTAAPDRASRSGGARGRDVEKARLERAFSLRLGHLANGQWPTGWK
jgi:hypothetical protein